MVATRGAYDKAMRLAAARLRIQDPNLLQGTVEMVNIQVTKAKNSYDVPWGSQGGFAVVYKFRAQNGHKAIRCFCVTMKSDIQQRYERLNHFFHANLPDITAGFTYYANGIDVEETEQGVTKLVTRPIIVMDWIDGVNLNEKIDELCQRNDQVGLKKLADQWLAVVDKMRSVRMAHGDLAAGNIMVRTDGRLVLVDYDGVYIPEFQGMSAIVAGQVDYQHPDMQKHSIFNEHMDTFSIHVIWIALRALYLQPQLWNRYAIKSNGKLVEANLLFTRQDFLRPNQSPLFKELVQLAMNDAELKIAIEKLKRACQTPLEQIQLSLPDSEYKEKEQLIKLQQAIQAKDDAQTVQLWSPLLDNYAPAQQYRSEVNAARQRSQTLKKFQDALKTRKLQHIADSYSANQHVLSNLSSDELECALLALDFTKAYRNDDVETVVAQWERISNSPHHAHLTLTGQEQRYVTQAQNVAEALKKFRLAIYSRNISRIAQNYNTSVKKYLLPAEIEQVKLAQEFLKAYQQDNDDEIATAYDEIEKSSSRGYFIFTEQMLQRIYQAQQHKMILTDFRTALVSKNIERIVSSYDVLLETSPQVQRDELERLKLARAFRIAYLQGNDVVLATARDAIEQSPHRSAFILTTEEQQRTNLAQQRQAALTQLHQAISSTHIQQIAAAASTRTDLVPLLTPDVREIVQFAERFVQAYQNNENTALASCWKEIQQSRHSHIFVLTNQEQQRITKAQAEQTALSKFRLARYRCHDKNAQALSAAYIPILATCQELSEDERELVRSAQQFVTMYQSMQQALAANNHTGDDKRIFALYDQDLIRKFTDFTPQEMQRINLAVKRSFFEYALKNNITREIIQLAHEIEVGQCEPLADEKQREAVKVAKQRFIQQYCPEQLQAHFNRQDGKVTVTWQWPSEQLVQYAAVAWRIDNWPQKPEERNTYLYPPISRYTYEQYGYFQFHPGLQSRIYLQVYFAIPDHETFEQGTLWLYSSGDNNTCRREVILH